LSAYRRIAVSNPQKNHQTTDFYCFLDEITGFLQKTRAIEESQETMAVDAGLTALPFLP
jgi:hypothetical protein